MERKLDRLVQFDERSKNYPVRTLTDTKAPRSYTWSCKTILDQGQDGACVGFSWSHELAARPKVVPNVDNTTAENVYHIARTLDDWDGENYDGTSVLAGIKAVQQIYPGKIKEYRWSFNLDDLILAIGHLGPAVIGINWYESMFNPDAKGQVHISGQIAGGHAILVNGVNIKNKLFRLHNSWGPNWAINGECFISFDDVNRLLSEDGEACVPTLRGK